MVKWFLSTEEAPGVPKAFLGFLYLKKKKKIVSHRHVYFSPAPLPRTQTALRLGVSRQDNAAFDNLKRSE